MSKSEIFVKRVSFTKNVAFIARKYTLTRRAQLPRPSHILERGRHMA